MPMDGIYICHILPITYIRTCKQECDRVYVAVSAALTCMNHMMSGECQSMKLPSCTNYRNL